MANARSAARSEGMLYLCYYQKHSTTAFFINIVAHMTTVRSITEIWHAELFRITIGSMATQLFMHGLYLLIDMDG